MDTWEDAQTSELSPVIKKRSLLKTSTSIFGVFVLVGGIVVAVIAAQNSTENRSRAYDGSYSGGYNSGSWGGSSGSYGSNYGGSYSGSYDHYDSGNYSYHYAVSPSPVYVKPSPTPIKTWTNPTPTIAWGSLFSPTKAVLPTPTKAPTSAPVQPTAQLLVTVAPSQPQPTATPEPTEGPTPTDLPGFESTPEPTSIPGPTDTPEPTPTPAPDDTVVSMTLGLHGIGTAGENLNATSVGNEIPTRTERTITIDVYDLFNKLVTSRTQTIIYDDASGKFEGAIDLGPINSGSYTIKVKTDQYLSSRIARANITKGEMNELPAIVLRGGDVNNDDKINILDYNMLMGCYSDLLPPSDCSNGDDVRADLNDDGQVNAFDYNFFLRELSSKLN